MKQTNPIIQRSGSTRLGALAWVLGTIQFLLCQLIVGAAWSTPYSWSLYNVSDLGNIYCQPWGDEARYVCSPLHNLMNASFIAEGILIIAGVILLRGLWGSGCVTRVAQVLLVMAGLGFVVVGFIPADANENLHVVLGVPPIFFLGNIGLLLAGPALNTRYPTVIRLSGPIIGIIGLTAGGLFLSGNYLGLGRGMERLTGFNVPAWTLLMGCYLLLKPAANTEGDSPHTSLAE